MTVRPTFGARRRPSMLRRLRAFIALAAGVAAVPAVAQEPTPEDDASAEPDTAAPEEPAPQDQPPATPLAEAGAPTTIDEKLAPASDGWKTYVSGYFRAPLAIGMSPRRAPDDRNAPAEMQ